MKATVTLQSIESHELNDQANEDDPKYLKSVISNLIKKSKKLVITLQNTLDKLDKTQKQRDFWKNQYIYFRESCHKYVSQDNLSPLQQILELEEQLKILSVQKNVKEKQYFTTKLSCQISREVSATKQKKRMNKSISTISFNKEHHLQSRHQIVPKKINLVRRKQKKPVVRLFDLH